MSKRVVESTADGVLLRVAVKPRSRARTFIANIGVESVNLNLKAPAREGKANAELLKRVAKLLKLSTADVILVSGSKSRDKTLLIRGVTADRVLSVLQAVKNNK
ncbi:MAG: YggU family protein [Candidatus Thorarchaeota archaeon]|nr:YggU family protein [Candidatus Thorarchaeota archaeon]